MLVTLALVIHLLSSTKGSVVAVVYFVFSHHRLSLFSLQWFDIQMYVTIPEMSVKI